MMLAGQAAAGDVHQHAAHDRAQRLLGEKIVADVIDRHEGAAFPVRPQTPDRSDTFAPGTFRGAIRQTPYPDGRTKERGPSPLPAG